MDPSYNKTVSGAGTGGQPQPPVQPVFGAGVGSTRTPQQPASASTMASGSGQAVANNGLAGSIAANNTSTIPSPTVPSASPTMGTNQNSAFGPTMASSAIQTAANPVATGMESMNSGAGDIILAPEKKSNKKLLIIIVAVVGLVAAIAFAVFMVTRGGVGGNASDIEYTGLRGAFNKYANYFISGEESAKDIPIAEEEQSDEEGADDESEENVATDADLGIEVDNPLSDEEVENDEGEEMSEQEISEVEAENGFDLSSVYFFDTIWSDDGDAYKDNIMDYFENFRAMYVEEHSNDEDFLNGYENQLYYLLINSGVGALNEEIILDAYVQGGYDNALQVVTKAADAYANISDIDELNIHDLFFEYGERELLLLEKYNSNGCINNNEIISACVNSINDEATLELMGQVSESEDMIIGLTDDCDASVYDDIYYFADTLYNEEQYDENNSGDENNGEAL